MEDAFLDMLVDNVFEMRGYDGLGRLLFHGGWIISDDQAFDLFLKEPSLNPHVIYSFLHHPLLCCLLLQKGINHTFQLSKLYIDLVPQVPLDISKEFRQRGLLSWGDMPHEVFVKHR